ncbi:MAG TPA: LysE family transporter [Puia sp.]|jgi:threonine/homoserine/homoserine lactone efflux protein|nr:LysE family transporter [Puia sp.]
MMESILKGLALGVVLALSVGPIIFTIIKQSLNSGHKGGFSFVAGVWISDILLVVLSNTLTALVSALQEHTKVIAFCGGGFLIAMGIYFVFFKKAVVAGDTAGGEARFRKRDMARIFASGFIINTLNPGVILFWLGNATALSISHTLRERIVIFSVCLLINMAADTGKVMMAGKLRNKLTAYTLSVINKIAGTILIGFGIALLWDVIVFHQVLR